MMPRPFDMIAGDLGNLRGQAGLPAAPGAVEPATGDALLLGLAQLWTATAAAADAFEEAAAETKDRAFEIWFGGARDARQDRQDALMESMLAIPASGLAGAQVQAAALYFSAFRWSAFEPAPERERLMWCAHQSILAVLQNATGQPNLLHTEMAGLQRDYFTTDVPAVIAAIRHFLSRPPVDTREAAQ